MVKFAPLRPDLTKATMLEEHGSRWIPRKHIHARKLRGETELMSAKIPLCRSPIFPPSGKVYTAAPFTDLRILRQDSKFWATSHKSEFKSARREIPHFYRKYSMLKTYSVSLKREEAHWYWKNMLFHK